MPIYPERIPYWRNVEGMDTAIISDRQKDQSCHTGIKLQFEFLIYGIEFKFI